MVNEEEIKELAYSIWEEEGRPEGKDLEHYFRAQKILEEKCSQSMSELESLPRNIEWTSSHCETEVQHPAPVSRRRNRTKKPLRS